MKYKSIPCQPECRIVVIISDNTEWRIVCSLFPDQELQPSSLGEWFVAKLDIDKRNEHVLFFHGGWGKIAAAASTQYVIDRWSPELLINSRLPRLYDRRPRDNSCLSFSRGCLRKSMKDTKSFDIYKEYSEFYDIYVGN